MLVWAFSQLHGLTPSSVAGDDNAALAQVVAKGDAILFQKYGYKPDKVPGGVYGLGVDDSSGGPGPAARLPNLKTRPTSSCPKG